MAMIALSRGLVALIDDADESVVRAHSWYAAPAAQRDERYYAVGKHGDATLYMHRLILNCPRTLQVDHRNGDGLDNRRENLRIATRSQNNANKRTVNPTGFRGVRMQKGRYRAHIVAPPECGRTTIHLGAFGTAEEAARAYDRAALARFGEFARLNFPASA